MIEFIIGLAVGAAFAPFWIKVWDMISNTTLVSKFLDKVEAFFASFK